MTRSCLTTVQTAPGRTDTLSSAHPEHDTQPRHQLCPLNASLPHRIDKWLD